MKLSKLVFASCLVIAAATQTATAQSAWAKKGKFVNETASSSRSWNSSRSASSGRLTIERLQSLGARCTMTHYDSIDGVSAWTCKTSRAIYACTKYHHGTPRSYCTKTADRIVRTPNVRFPSNEVATPRFRF